MPGPPSSVVTVEGRRAWARVGLAGLWVLLAVAASAHFVFQTAVVPTVPDPSLVFGGAVAAALFLLAIGDRPRMDDLRRLGGRNAALAFSAGILGLVVAPALVVVNRYSDAPAGSVVAFWTTAGWGLLLVVASAIRGRRPVRAAGALVALVGCMGILGSWERPSSFSLLVRFPAEEASFVIAGIAWVAFAVIIGGLARDHGPRAPYALAAVGGLVGSLVWGLPASGWRIAALVPPATALPAVLASGVVVVLTVHLTRRCGAHVAGAAMLAVPALLTTLLVVERATGTFGPRPIILDEAAWGSAVVAIGIAVVLAGVSRFNAGRNTALFAVAGVVALGSLGISVYSLTQPGVAAAVRGTTLAGAAFAADFALSAARTVGGWLALAAALLAVAAWLERPPVSSTALAFAAGVVVGVAHATLAFTPLHTWMPWIPAEIQQDYGTEYASLTFTSVSTTAQVVGIIGACVAIGLLLVWRSLSDGRAGIPPADGAGGRER